MSTVSSKGKAPATAEGPSEATPETLTLPSIEVRTMQQPLAIVKPMRFDGREEEVDLFVLQMRSTILLQADRLADPTTQVLYAMSLMKGKALKWAMGHQKKWYRYRDSPQNMDRDTRYIMTDFEAFADEMETVFGKANIEREAAAKIYRLRQRGSLNDYTTEFLNLNAVLEWREDALIPLYEKGLTDEIKDAMIHITRPNRLRPLIEKVRAINHNIQERRNDKKYGWQPRFQKKERQEKKTSGGSYLGPGPMEIDKVQHKEKTSGDSKKKGVKCFNCGKKGHYARECRGEKKEHPKQQICMMRHTQGSSAEEGESSGTETIRPLSFVDPELTIQRAPSPVRPGQGVPFPRQAMNQTAEYAECMNWVVEVVRRHWHVLPVGVQRDLQSVMEGNPSQMFNPLSRRDRTQTRLNSTPPPAYMPPSPPL
jgi:Domain of unknown function (DUF4939)/Zinc knuckle